MSAPTEQMDFKIQSLDLPIPIISTIFGVKVLLHVPSQVFPLLRSNISNCSSPQSFAALSEWIQHLHVPTTFINILNQSNIFLQNHHECPQYIDDSIIFLSNAFPDIDIEIIINTLELFNSDLYNASLYLNQEYSHALSDSDSNPIEIQNTYAAHQISNLLAFDIQYQAVAKPYVQYKKQIKSESKNLHNQLNVETLNLEEKIKLAEKEMQKQEKDDATFALALLLHMEEEEQSEIRQNRLRKITKEDENYARILQAHLEEEEIAEKKKREEEEKMVECCCCFIPIPFIEMVQCPEGHLICRRCIEMSIETALGEGRVRTDCPCIDGCNKKISLSELERILPKKLMIRLDEAEALNAVTEVNISGLRTCWKCGYKAIDETEDNPFICPQCEEKSCKKCGKKHHQGRTCDEADLDPNRIVEKKMSEAIVKQCPKCQTQFIKDEGCNHMTCPRCHTEFCYLCGKVINGQVNQHYKSCTQFMDNNKYNDEQIQNARSNAIKDLGIS